jgi:murein lipoprotein
MPISPVPRRQRAGAETRRDRAIRKGDGGGRLPSSLMARTDVRRIPRTFQPLAGSFGLPNRFGSSLFLYGTSFNANALKGKYMPASLSKISTVALVMIGSVGLGGCATKGYVNEQIATVNTRVDGVDSRLRTVEGTSSQALAQAQAASGQAQQNTQRLDQINGRVDGLEQRMQEQMQQRQRRPRG